MIFKQVQTGLVFVLQLNTILGFQYRASTPTRLQTFKIRIENESRVDTPLRRNLTVTSVTQNLGLDYSLQPFGKTRKNISQDLSTPDDIRSVSNKLNIRI